MEDNRVNGQPFHEGEVAVQERTGERELARRHGAAISSRIAAGSVTRPPGSTAP